MIPPFAQLLPSQRDPVVDQSGAFTNAFWRVILALWNRSGQGTGVPMQVDNPVTAAGAAQATATPLTLDWTEVTTAAAGTGVVMADLKVGQQQIVFNSSGNALLVYPFANAAAPIHIDALADNAGYTLADNQLQVFMLWSLTRVRTFGRLQIP